MAFLPRLQRMLPFLVVIAAAAWLWGIADDLASQGRPGRVGPDVWPKIVLALMLAAAVWGAVKAALTSSDADGASILIKQATRSVGREQEAEEELQAEAQGTGPRQPLYALGGMAAMLGFVAAIPYVGFLVATFVLMTAIILLSGYPRPGIALAVAGLGTMAFFFVFQKVAYISLPLGEGPFRVFSTTVMALIGVR